MIRNRYWKDKNKEQYNQQEIKDLFLNHYFSEIASKNNLPLSALTPPTNSKANTYFRSINRAYVSILEQSNPFMEQFRDVLKTDFIKECKEEFIQRM